MDLDGLQLFLARFARMFVKLSTKTSSMLFPQQRESRQTMVSPLERTCFLWDHHGGKKRHMTRLRLRMLTCICLPRHTPMPTLPLLLCRLPTRVPLIECTQKARRQPLPRRQNESAQKTVGQRVEHCLQLPELGSLGRRARYNKTPVMLGLLTRLELTAI